MNNFFTPKSIAIFGVSRDQKKLGHVILSNLLDSKYKGKLFCINPNANMILNFKCYKNASQIKEKIDLAIVCVSADNVINVMNDCGKKKIRNAIIVTAGFSEVGNKNLEIKLKNILQKYKIKTIGPNCLGILDTYSGLDTLFLPRSRMHRPMKGGISFICQSGAVGSSIMDLSTREGLKFSKFISYGNAIDIDESDLLDYLKDDKTTNVICVYLEGVHNGNKFFNALKNASKKKPVIVIKGGTTHYGARATLSHTGSLAGSPEVYQGIFRQANIIQAETLEEMFDYARIFENCSKPRGRRIQIITNGGGFGVLSADAVEKFNLTLAEFSDATIKKFSGFPDYYVISNPLDLTGSANTEEFELAINASMNDSNTDLILATILTQTISIDTSIVETITEIKRKYNKPFVVVSCGGDFTQLIKADLEQNGVACYQFPTNAVKSLSMLCNYYLK